MHRLLLLRHGKSSYKDKSLSDFDRPLAKRGKADSRRIGRWMASEKLMPDLVISSPAKRAAQTTRRVCKMLGIDKSSIQWDDAMYNAETRTVLRTIERIPESVRSVLVIGHHEALESMILRLSRWSDIPPYPKLIPTSALAWLELEGNWSEIEDCKATLKSITRPKELALEEESQ